MCDVIPVSKQLSLLERPKSMLTCPKCETENALDELKCTQCGQSLAKAAVGQDDPFIGRRLGRNFILRRNLGSGEIGVVYEAVNEEGTRRVAIKILHPDVAATFGEDLLRWAKQAAKIRHAKIANILGANRLDDGSTFIVTEFVTGQTLMEVLRNSGPLKASRVADILFQLCSALAPIHRAGRPHANLKPENVFVEITEDGDEFVRIVDVGSPVIFGAHHLAGERQVVGSPKYFSPEQASGESVGLPSDQFTLGIIGYLLLTGALPFFGATPDQLLQAIIEAVPKPIQERTPRVPAELAKVMERCLSKSPSDRYDGLRSLAKDLASIIKAQRFAEPSISESVDEVDLATRVVKLSELVDEPSVDMDDSMAGDPDRTVVFSVPSKIAAFIESEEGTDSVADESIDLDVKMDSIPRPLTFTGELESADIESAIEATVAQVENSADNAQADNVSVVPEAQEDANDEPEDLTAAMAAAIEVLGDEDGMESADVLREVMVEASVPITDPPAAMAAGMASRRLFRFNRRSRKGAKSRATRP